MWTLLCLFFVEVVCIDCWSGLQRTTTDDPLTFFFSSSLPNDISEQAEGDSSCCCHHLVSFFRFLFVCLFLLLVVAYTRWCTCVYIAHIVSVVCVMAELFIWYLIAGRQTWRGRDATVEPAVDDAQVRLASRSWAFGGDKLRSQRTWSWDAQDDPRRQLLDSQRTFRSLA